jgi:hypothetical protein
MKTEEELATMTRRQRYYWRHRDLELAKSKVYHEKHKEEICARHRKRTQEHPEVWQSYQQAHRKEAATATRNYRARHPELKPHWYEKHREFIKNNPERAKIYWAKHAAKRKRNLGWITLYDNPFDEEVEWHHINDTFVVAIPKDLHQLYLGKNHRENLEYILRQLYITRHGGYKD